MQGSDAAGLEPDVIEDQRSVLTGRQPLDIRIVASRHPLPALAIQRRREQLRIEAERSDFFRLGALGLHSGPKVEYPVESGLLIAPGLDPRKSFFSRGHALISTMTWIRKFWKSRDISVAPVT